MLQYFLTTVYSSPVYFRPPSVFDAIGDACAKSGSTIPSTFGARIPDIAKDRYQCTAKFWFLFTTLLAPVLLHNRFSRRCYYNHFIQFILLIDKCLRFELTPDEISVIEPGFAAWVEKYEKLYYQYKESRLSACTLPIHALLHITENIRKIGPMWCFWAFVMERFCGSLVPAVKSRKYPFTSLAHRIQDVTQLRQIKSLYSLTAELDLSPGKDMEETGLAFDDYPDICMMYPHHTMAVDTLLQNKITSYLATNYDLKRLGGGDLIHARDLVSTYHTSLDAVRDATFIKFTLEVDKNQNHHNLPVVLQPKPFFGQVRKFIALTVPPGFPA
ncbi:hypothetical protein B0H17DRAFT_1218741 [Mycena rosella]|uniref:DUF4218 domain-containing protein n=1 Tax=Mycena rosella TaxID=1033263 RepID=A0AAD7BM68_MYCRO|nr:hypothetical protein B0H17DRAFT_1218741 [Mycena rosella]